MPGQKPPFYVTTPIYYVNDVPHIGHAYTTLACDVLARFKRLDGYDVMFLTGTDEHGQKVAKSAEAAGTDPQSYTDKISQNFRDLCRVMNYSNDDFIRTTEPRHITASQAIWQALEKNGDIYLGSYSGWYAVRDEAFYGEDELTDGPNGKKVAPSGAEVEWMEEPSYFFRLSAWQDRLLKLYEENPDFVAPQSRRNEILSFVRSGLRDLSISRTTFNWGVKVPGDEKHVMYVWLDALTNYITAVGYPETGEGTPFARYWPADLHMVGKDIIRFHTVYWPAFLMAAGLEPPKRVFAHGWWTIEGQKMSKSLGNVIPPAQLVSTYGLDQTRWFLLREVPFGNDGDFSHRAMVQRINSDLANGIGNLAQRTLTLIQKNCAAAVPQPAAFNEEDEAEFAWFDGLWPKLQETISAQQFHEALATIMSGVSRLDIYIDKQAPWTLRKTDPDRMATVLYVLADCIRRVGIALQPFMPDSAAKILDLLALSPEQRGAADLGQRLAPGTKLPAPQGVFPRFVEAERAAG